VRAGQYVTHHYAETVLNRQPEPEQRSRIIEASPVYYGWVVVGAATISLGLTLPGQTAGVSLFIDHFIEDLGISRGAVSLAYTLATLLAALVLPWAGRALDRYGPRRGVVMISLLFGLACLSMSAVQGAITLFFGFLLLRALGQGSLSLASVHVVNLWFVRRRGLAIGIMGLGMALTTAFGPPLIEYGLGTIGWRATYVVIGLALLAILVPVGGLFFRGHPEGFGLRPDSASESKSLLDERTYTLTDARKTVMFWLLVGGIVCTSAVGTGLLFHHVAIMSASGVDRAAAALLFVPYGLVTLPSNLGAGMLIDRFGPRRMMIVHLLLFTLMVAAVPLVRDATAVMLYGALFGLTQGFQNNLSGSGFAYYFGRLHIGAIKGFTSTVFVAGTAIGPLVIAYGAQLTAGYAPILWLLAGVSFVLALVATRSSLDLPRS
jgi:MFS family permease